MKASPLRTVALIVLPTFYNADAHGRKERVESEKFTKTMEEIAEHFGGGVLWRFDREVPTGYWWDRGVLYVDELAAIEVDIPLGRQPRAWLVEYAKTTLLHRFRQEAIYVKFIRSIEVETVVAD